MGLGLIGGSLARALREREAASALEPTTLVAWTPGGVGPLAALDAGIVDLAAQSPEDAIQGADLIVLAAPVPACLAMLDDLAGPWREALAPDSVVTDVASTKSALILRATALGLRFVGGHPMAGREVSGFRAATGDLFVDRPWIVVPGADDAALARVEALARSVGARPVRLSASAHDGAVAGISHLPLVVSSALVEAVAGTVAAPRDGWADTRGLTAGGWRDTTRLARGDVAMGTGILVTNAAPIAARLRELIVVLGSWVDELDREGGPDPEVARLRLAGAKEMLETADS